MGKALDADKVDLYVDLFSIWSCMGRLIAGYGSDVMLRRGIPRPVCLSAAYLSLMAGCLLLATGCKSC
jgi:sugar phosphate permease